MSKPYTVITGASEGIGRCFATLLAAQGHNLILVARNLPQLGELRDELQARHGVTILAVGQDLAAPDAVRAVGEAVGDRPVDGLINNAGYQVPIGPFALAEPEAVRAMIAVNLVALTDLTRLLLPALIQTRGAVVNVASHAAFQPVPYMAAYAATKAYVLHLSEALGQELADSKSGVYVMAFCPGATRTNFWSRSASPLEHTRFPVMAVEDVVAVAVRELKRRRKPVVIPSLLLRAATQTLRVSTRALNLKLARLLTGYQPSPSKLAQP